MSNVNRSESDRQTDKEQTFRKTERQEQKVRDNQMQKERYGKYTESNRKGGSEIDS